MDNSNDTKTIKTPSGAEVVIRTIMTGRMKREITAVYLDEARIGVTAKGEADIQGISGTVASKVEDKTIEKLVVSINGKTDDVLNTLLDLEAEDLEFVVAELNLVTNKKKVQSSQPAS